MPYLAAGSGGRVEQARLPVFEAYTDGLPDSLDAILCTGDLQGIVRAASGNGRLLGEVLAEELPGLLPLLGLAPQRTGVILSGDLYSAPDADERGASGDVRAVWEAFLQNFRWVVGVPGNHDQFGRSAADLEAFTRQPGMYHLDATTVRVDALSIAGLGGIIGNPDRPMRRASRDYIAQLTRLVRGAPALMILHQSPGVELQSPGDRDLGSAYQNRQMPLTICGHVSWPHAVVEMGNGNQLLNVDSKAILLRRAEKIKAPS